MIQISDNAKEQQLIPIFRLGFRPFFLAGTIFSVLSMLAWIFILTGKITLPSQIPPIIWHAHEMLFGFAGAIILGFLLTAVQNWTGFPGLKGKRLASLFALWLSARIALFAFPVDLFWLTFILEVSWMPLAAMVLGQAVMSAKQWRNLFFVPLLFAMSLLNIVSLLALQSGEYFIAQQAIWSMFFLVLFIIAVMGGRVIPFFTAKGTATEKATVILGLEYLCLAPLLFLAILVWFPSLGAFAVPLALIAGIANLVRLLRWKPQLTLPVPLLWSLHLSYFLLSIGLVFYALGLLVPSVSSVSMIHLSAIGGIGGVILAMISRVSLGHTGRTLNPSKWMNIAFIATALSALTRVVLPYLMPDVPLMGYAISALLWCSAFMLFIIFYAKMLLSARIDKRPG
ncbi:NnrS family protein [Psychromonas sp. RZ22]|uniref:NnrS family protein n=1 Tax=Psychromonas algarum TaxID=2555643 RepID=UPI001067D293|nr:NnrS family protein [Psychromonas sp. RZ22]TEW56686.1 NnrS family protein [Psychromonas sp. RZ22]